MSLIERLEAAEVGSAALSREVCIAALMGRGKMISFTEVTTSLDAALALAERILPGWTWQIEIYPETVWVQGAEVAWPEGLVASDRGGVYVHGRIPALTFCIAILKAKETK